MMIAGIGCRKGVEADEIISAVDAALSEHRLERAALSALASVPSKGDEPALPLAAQALSLPLRMPSQAELERAAGRTISHSGASISAVGLPSASEAAALAAAGDNSRLLGPRIAVGPVTCAIAAARESQ